MEITLEGLKTDAKTIGISIDVDEAVKNAETEISERNIVEMSAEEVKKLALLQIHHSFKRQRFSDAENFENIVFVGIEGINDWDKRQHDKIVDDWNKASQEDRESMVQRKTVTVDGKPLKKNFKQDAFIEINPNSTKRVLHCLVKNDTGVELKKLYMYNNKKDLIPKLYCPTTFRAAPNKNNSNILMSRSVTEFHVTGTEIEFDKVVENHLKENLKSVNELSFEDDNKMVVLKSFVVMRITETGDGKNNAMQISSEDMEDEKSLTCWVPKELDMPSEDAIGAYLLGKVSKRTDKQTNAETLQIQVYGIWVPPAFRLLNKPKPIEDTEKPKVEEAPPKAPENVKAPPVEEKEGEWS